MSNIEMETQENLPKRKLEDNTESEPDQNGASTDLTDSESKRQKLDHNPAKPFGASATAAAMAPYTAFTLTRLEPVELPEGEPSTMSEIHAMAFNEKLPEEIEQFCSLGSCDVCSIYHRSANGKIGNNPGPGLSRRLELK